MIELKGVSVLTEKLVLVQIEGTKIISVEEFSRNKNSGEEFPYISPGICLTGI